MAVADIVFVREGRWFVAQPLRTDIASQGRSVDSAVHNLREAMALGADGSHLDVAARSGRSESK